MERNALMIGSTVADVMIRLDHLPSLEEDINVTGQSCSLGGCCFNASNMLACYGVNYTLFSPVGTGVFGAFVKAELKKRGIVPVLTAEEENGCCYCMVDAAGNRTFVAVHGAEYRMKREWFDALDAKKYTDAYVCGLELEEPTGDVIVSFLQANRHLSVYFAPSSRILAIPAERMDAMLDLHPVLHLNRREASAFLFARGLSDQKEPDVSEVLSLLQQRTGSLVVLTDGSRGAWAYDGKEILFEPPVPVKAVDGTGAGDCHIGTFIARRMCDDSVAQALHHASVCAAAVVCRSGAILDKEEFEAALAANL